MKTFCFWPFVNAQEFLEVTTKHPVKLNDPVIDLGTKLYVSTFKGALNRYPKIPFSNTFEICFFVSVKYEIWCGKVVFKRDNIANIS
jgi:hypothetical protein